MIDGLVYTTSGVLFLALVGLDMSAKRAILPTATAEVVRFVIAMTAAVAGTLALTPPDAVLRTILVAIVIVLGGLAAGAYVLVIRFFAGKPAREVWKTMDADAQAAKLARASKRQNLSS